MVFFLAAILFPAGMLSQQKEFPLNPIFLPVVFDGKFPADISLSLPADTLVKKEALSRAFPVPASGADAREKTINRLRTGAYRYIIQNDIRSVKYSLSDFPAQMERVEEIKPNIFKHLFTVETEYGNGRVDKSTRFVPKRKYWLLSGSTLLQFSENYISKNWYNGGVGNLNMVSVQNFTANYIKDKLQFNNFIEWKLSFYTNPNDTLRPFRLGEDMVRTYSDFGLTAFNNKWSYSSNLEIKTKLFRSYPENSNTYISSIFAPLQINLGVLGMKYQLNKTSKEDKDKKQNFSIDLSPLSVQYTWVADKHVDPAKYGIKEKDSRHLLDVGSTLNAKAVINFNRHITFTSRLKYFTNYKKSIAESENELNIALNRFFSTRLYVYGRFDDSQKNDNCLGYFQINELFSFGFNYKWN
jgi:hypothetical protein